MIGVLGILTSLLFPAVSSARVRADAARCVGNLRQIGIALRVYAGDNDGTLPVAVHDRAGLTAQSPFLEEVLGPQVSGNRKVFKCPADEKKNPSIQGSSYEWNSALNGRLLHRIEDAAGTWLARDLERWHRKGARNAVFVDGNAGVFEDQR